MNSYSVEIVNKVLSVGTILMQILALIVLVNLIFFRKKENTFLIFIKNNTFIFGFLVALAAFTMSLFYSEIVGYPPCELCWMQRIFLYPQLVLYSIDLYKKDHSIVDFSLAFAIIGSLISMYHIYVENGGTTGLACATGTAISSPNQVSCAIRYIYEFGYITMPVMCLTASLFIIVILINYKYITKSRS